MRRRLFPLFAVLAAPFLLGADAPKLPDLPIETYTLPNGLKVVLHRDRSVPRVSVVVGYHVGSKNESAGRTGFAHFFEHMMFRGTKNVPNYDVPLQETGAQSNAFTSEDMTVYFEEVPAAFLERALYLEAERLAFLPSALDQAKFDTEREVVKNERRQSVENVPYGIADEIALAAFYPKGHPYSWSVIGSMKDLDGSTIDDLRRFFAEFYHPGNAVLVLAGDFDPKTAKDLIKKYFGPLAAGPKLKPVVAKPFEVEPGRTTVDDQVSLPRIDVFWRTPADDHPDTPALDLLAKIFGMGETSRLHKALVRDSRLAKSAGASNPTKEIAGQFVVSATLNEGKTVAEVEAAIFAELAKFKANPPTEAELKRALAEFETSTYESLTSPQARAFAFVSGVLMKNDPLDYRKHLEKYFQVTTDDLKRVLNQYLTDRRRIVEIRPIKAGGSKSTGSTAGPIPAPESKEAVATRTPKAGVDWSKMPGPSTAPAFVAPKFAVRKLSNGVELWHSRWSTLPLVKLRLSMATGSINDPEDKLGLAQLVATLATKGTKSKNAVEFSEALESLGASLNVSAGVERTTVGLDVLVRNLAPALDLATEMLESPRFEASDFDREKQDQLTSILQGPDSPGWIAGRVFPTLIHGAKHPLGRGSIGTSKTVNAITLDDVKTFAERSYITNNARLIVVGDVPVDAIVAELEKSIARWKRTGTPAPAAPLAEAASRGATIYLVDKPGAVQSVISIGRKWAGRKADTHLATEIGNHIFGGDFLSRLNQNLRERNGYSYGAGSRFGYSTSGSVWSIGTSVRADATAPALKEILDELDGLETKKPLSAEEVELARSAILRSYPEGFDDPTGILGAVSEIAQFGLAADEMETYLARVEAVAGGVVTKTMSTLADPGPRRILVVGDRKAIEEPLKKLNRGEVRVITLEEALESR